MSLMQWRRSEGGGFPAAVLQCAATGGLLAWGEQGAGHWPLLARLHTLARRLLRPARWDYGYQTSAMANRTGIVDNNTWNNTHIATVGRAMCSSEYKVRGRAAYAHAHAHKRARTSAACKCTHNHTQACTHAMCARQQGWKIYRSLDVDYVLVVFGGALGYPSDDINKFLWMVRACARGGRANGGEGTKGQGLRPPHLCF